MNIGKFGSWWDAAAISMASTKNGPLLIGIIYVFEQALLPSRFYLLSNLVVENVFSIVAHMHHFNLEGQARQSLGEWKVDFFFGGGLHRIS